MAAADIAEQSGARGIDLFVFMGISMDPDGMSFVKGALQDFFAAADLSADDKKCGADIFFSENIQYFRSGGIGRAVVKGQTDRFYFRIARRRVVYSGRRGRQGRRKYQCRRQYQRAENSDHRNSLPENIRFHSVKAVA